MKKLFISLLMLIGLVSCSKDSLDPLSDNSSFIEQSELLVTATHLSWSDLPSDLNCSGGGTSTISYIQNARVDLYQGNESGSDQSGGGRKFGVTDMTGSILFENLEPGQYTISVDTPYGLKTRTIFTQMNRRTWIEFSF